MTRTEFVHRRNADFRFEMMRGGAFFALLILVRVCVVLFDRYWESRGWPPNLSVMEFGLVVGIGLLLAFGMFVVIRPRPTRQLKCPHCNKHLGYRSGQVAVKTGKCRHCGSQIIADTEQVGTTRLEN